MRCFPSYLYRRTRNRAEAQRTLTFGTFAQASVSWRLILRARGRCNFLLIQQCRASCRPPSPHHPDVARCFGCRCHWACDALWGAPWGRCLLGLADAAGPAGRSRILVLFLFAPSLFASIIGTTSCIPDRDMADSTGRARHSNCPGDRGCWRGSLPVAGRGRVNCQLLGPVLEESWAWNWN